MTKEQLELFGFITTGLDKSASRMELVDVPNPEKRKPGRYPQPGWTPTIKVEKQVGGTLPTEWTIAGPISAYRALFFTCHERWRNGQSMATSLTNHHLLRDFANDTRAEWRGGTAVSLIEALKGHQPLTYFNTVRDELADAEWVQSLIMAADAEKPRRRKVWGSEGQWEESRRWESEQFESFHRVGTPSKSLKIKVNMGQNASVDPMRILRFGATVWSVVDILEAAGVSVGLDVGFSARNGTLCDGTTLSEQVCNVKAAGEYLEPTTIAAVMTPNFFRRAVFTARVSGEDARGLHSCSGLGSSWDMGAAKYQDGVLTISASDARDMGKIAELVVSEVIQAGEVA